MKAGGKKEKQKKDERQMVLNIVGKEEQSEDVI